MQEVKAQLKERVKRTDTVESFHFILPQKINFTPGQFLQVIFDEQNRQNKELNKYLSFSCAPGKDYIEVTKRVSDSLFSSRLSGLKSGNEVLLKLPMGECVFRDSYQEIIFLIGGIGITPVISILEYIMDKKLETKASLFYSNRKEEEIAFKKELDAWQAANPRIKVFYTVTECQPKDKTCFFGHINKDLLSKYACNLTQQILFIFGPPKMVDAMRSLALELNCRPENLRTERFMGY